jgi:carbon starvation protein CstA
MILFLLGLAILIAGYFTYGRLVEKIVAPDDREVPAVTMNDGVDYVVMPKWKNMLIQLLNIAGIGPVIGVILGIKFGVIAFLIIPIGNIIGGAVHDFVSGMMSIRHNGANLPELIRLYLGRKFYFVFSIFMSLVLMLVVAVFINVPAKLITGMANNDGIFLWVVAAIFVYYIAATLFPVDKIIGRFYPIFGGLLLVGTLAIFGKLMFEAIDDPSILSESTLFAAAKFSEAGNMPLLPMLFVTIACGILSGFHATQSPIIARTMKSEREAKATFYGMMVLEGIIAMVWAAAALAMYNGNILLMKENPNTVLAKITAHFLGSGVGTITVLSVIILAITSGDTAMRSLRLSLAEIFKVPQTKSLSRILLCLPLIAIITGLLVWSNKDAKSFGTLWNYFAWGNQVLGASTLTAATVYLAREGKCFLITLIPGMFITFVVTTYILWISPAHGGPVGCGLDLQVSYIIALVVSSAVSGYAIWKAKAEE